MKKILSATISAGALFAVTAAGASMLAIDGSDSAPGTAATEASCAAPLTVTNPLDVVEHKVNRVKVEGVAADAFDNCVGQTLLLEIAIDPAAGDPMVAYAFQVITADDATANAITFTFGTAAGDDFMNTRPTVTTGALVTATGEGVSKVAVPLDSEYGTNKITIAKTWEA